MKKILSTVLFGIVAVFSLNAVNGAEYTANGITVDVTNNFGTDITPSEYLAVYDLSTSGTQTLWHVSSDVETGTVVFIYYELHAVTNFQTSVGIDVYSDQAMTTLVGPVVDDNENYYGAQGTGQWATYTISGLSIETDYYINITLNNPDTDPVYDDVNLATILGNPLHIYLESVSMITQILDAVSGIVTGAVTVVIALFANDGAISVFYTSENGLSLLGYLVVMVFGFGVVRWAFNYIVNLIRMRA